MKTALWETSPGALAALLHARGPLNKADVYTLTLAGGAVYRWSGHDTAIAGNGQLWVLGPGLRRSRVRFVVGIEVDNLALTITDNLATQVNGVALMAFIRAGGLAGARLQLDKVFWGPEDAAPVGALLWFSGRVADVQRVDRYEAQVNVKSDLETLDAMVPRDVYQAGCLNTLYDPACGADRTAKTVAVSATSASSAVRTSFGHGLAQPTAYFDLGVARGVTGANAGVARTIKAYTQAGTLVVLQPWPFAVAAGDQFSLVPGCTKGLYTDAALTVRDANGCWKFHADADVARRFRGQPFVPTPETVL